MLQCISIGRTYTMRVTTNNGYFRFDTSSIFVCIYINGLPVDPGRPYPLAVCIVLSITTLTTTAGQRKKSLPVFPENQRPFGGRSQFSRSFDAVRTLIYVCIYAYTRCKRDEFHDVMNESLTLWCEHK